MLDKIHSDLTRYYKIGKQRQSFFGLAYKLMNAYGFYTLMVYRFGYFIDKVLIAPYLLPIKYLFVWCYLIMSSIVSVLFGITINRHAEIGRGVKIGHFGGVAIGLCSIGEYCNIHQQVQIGENNASFNSKGPQIGNQVWVGAHSKIVGSIVIEDYATIAAGSVVTSDVKSGCLVIGNPARVINKNYDNSFLLGLPDEIANKRK